MKILFLMSHPGATRNFESTLRGLAAGGHAIHLAYQRTEKASLAGLWDLSNSLEAEYPSVTSGSAPDMADEDNVILASRLRKSLDYMRFSNPEFADAPKLRNRAERWVPERVKRVMAAAPSPARSAIRSVFERAERSVPISETATEFIREHEPDAVLVTPLLEPGSVQVELMRAAKRLGVPTCLCVHSWDNLTNKGLIHELPDVVTVWNDDQRAEAVELHGVPSERVVVTGAAAYDHWYDWGPSRSREEFAAAVGLAADRPFVTYLGSSPFIAPDEAGFIVKWAGELRERGLGDMQVLVRPHPVNPLIGDRPAQRALKELTNVTLYPLAGANPTDEKSREDYFDSLYYCSAAVGVNTSAFLEAAIVGRPVLTMLASRLEETQRGTLHFHHLLTTGGGLLEVATTYDDHAEQLRHALAAKHPDECVSERSTRFTQAFIRPFGPGEAATPRMVATVEGLPESKRGDPPGGTIGGAAMARVARVAVRRARRGRRSADSARARGQAKAAQTKSEKQAAKAERQKAKVDKHAAKAARQQAKAERERARAEKTKAAETEQPGSAQT